MAIQKINMQLRVVSNYVNIRKGPATSYADIGDLKKNDVIIATEKSGDWYHHSKGWSCMKNSYGTYLALVKDLSAKPVSTPKTSTTKATQSAQVAANTPTPKADNGQVNQQASLAATQEMEEVQKSFKEIDLPSNVIKLMEYNGFYSEKNQDWYENIKRFGYFDLYGALQGTREYLFFTRPDMNFFVNAGSLAESNLNPDIAKNSTLWSIAKENPRILAQLQASVGVLDTPLMNLLSNSVANTLDLPTISAKEVESASTLYGSKLYHRKSSLESDEGHDFSLEFHDTKWIELYKFFKAYDEYERMRVAGLVKARDVYRNKKKFYSQFSVYKIVVGADGYSIIFWAKLYGVYPKGVPRESFSEIGDKLVYSVPFKATWVRDMDPLILYEFNELVKPYIKSSYKDMPFYGDNAGTWPKIPYIKPNVAMAEGKANYQHLLLWKGVL